MCSQLYIYFVLFSLCDAPPADQRKASCIPTSRSEGSLLYAYVEDGGQTKDKLENMKTRPGQNYTCTILFEVIRPSNETRCLLFICRGVAWRRGEGGEEMERGEGGGRRERRGRDTRGPTKHNHEGRPRSSTKELPDSLLIVLIGAVLAKVCILTVGAMAGSGQKSNIEKTTPTNQTQSVK